MSATRNLTIGLSFFAATVVVGTVGYMLNGWSLIDSIYMVIITVFGVGFGEVHPLETPGIRVFTMCIIVAGTSSEIYTLGGLIQMVTEGEIRRLMGARRMRTEINNLNGHVIISGFGRIGQVLAEDLSSTSHPFVILDSSQERIASAQEHGYLALHADATEEEGLQNAGIERATVLATVLPDDALNVFITLTARALNSTLTIIARGELPSTHGKLVQAGANQVVLPTMIGAQRMASLIRTPVLDEVLVDTQGRQRLDSDLSRLGVRLQELPIPEDSPMVGQTIGEIESRGQGACLIVGIRHSHGKTLSDPDSSMLLTSGDTLLVIGHSHQLPRFIERNLRPRQTSYRGGLR